MCLLVLLMVCARQRLTNLAQVIAVMPLSNNPNSQPISLQNRQRHVFSNYKFNNDGLTTFAAEALPPMVLEPLTIRDKTSGAEARVLPGLGFNCFSFVVPVKSKSAADGTKSLEVLWSSPDLLTGKARPSGSGIPLMFPFAGRIRCAVYEFEGKKYQLEAGDGAGQRDSRICHQSPLASDQA